MSWRSCVRSERCRCMIWTPSAGGSTSSPTQVTNYLPGPERPGQCSWEEPKRRTARTQKLGNAPPVVVVFLHVLGSSCPSRICPGSPAPSLTLKGIGVGNLWGLEECSVVSSPVCVPHTLKGVGRKERFVDREDGALILKPVLRKQS